jgi:ribosomal protein L34E
MAWMICSKCGGSLQGIKRPDGLVYRCSLCGNEVTELPTRKPVLERKSRKDRRDGMR